MEALEKIIKVNPEFGLLNLIKEAKIYDSNGALTKNPVKKEYSCDCYTCQEIGNPCDCVCQQCRCDVGPCYTSPPRSDKESDIKYLG